MFSQASFGKTENEDEQYMFSSQNYIPLMQDIYVGDRTESRCFVGDTISFPLYTIIHQAILKPIIMYESEMWTLTARTELRIQASEMRVLRLI